MIRNDGISQHRFEEERMQFLGIADDLNRSAHIYL